MGFTPKRKIYVLDFEGDDELDGLEVRAIAAPIGMVLELGAAVDDVQDTPDPETAAALPPAAKTAMVKRSMAQLQTVIDMYARVLVSWNYVDERGEEVPATAEGMLTLDPAHLMKIIRAWQQAAAQVPVPLSGPSSSGGPSLVASLPMETSSASLAS